MVLIENKEIYPEIIIVTPSYLKLWKCNTLYIQHDNSCHYFEFSIHSMLNQRDRFSSLVFIVMEPNNASLVKYVNRSAGLIHIQHQFEMLNLV